ncbi:peptidoglycan editing factor PgeF [Candidatus Giovannonibacteria bacterium]|nr:peptidoglycan editing factor PgeF [Candidatus Giovannonibacteria bacterium]
MSIRFSIFGKYPELIYDFSDKSDGSMKWFEDPELFRPNLENRRNFFNKFLLHGDKIVTAGLVHGAKVQAVTDADTGSVINNTDALITKTRDVFLSLTAADCFPVYFYDPKKRDIGLAHAGWRGIVDGVIKNTVSGLEESFGSKPQDIIVGIGAGIRRCHFEILPDNSHFFKNHPDAIEIRNRKIFVDLPLIIKSDLISCGLQATSIEDSSLCTFCEERRYFSYRREKPKFVHAMIAYIGLGKQKLI